MLGRSGPPGPRGNLELARAAAQSRSPRELRRWAALDAGTAPTLVDRAAASGDPDLRWIVRETLRKRRLMRVDAGWVAELAGR